MLDARQFGYLGGLGGKSNFDSVLSGGVLTPEMQEGYDRGSGIKTRLNETDYSALSDYNLATKRAGYLGEDFDYNADYDDLSTNLMYHKDYVADSDELKNAKNSLRSAGFADIPLFQPSSWASAGVQFIKPNQFNAKTLPFSVAGAGAANTGIRESNVYDKLRQIYNEWGQYESSGFEGGNKMGGNKSNWEAMKSWNTGDRPESANSMASAYGSKEAMDKFLATGEITPDLNPTYALEAYDYAERETARQQQRKQPSLFSSILKGNIGAIIGATIGAVVAGPQGAAVGAAAGATAQGIEAEDSFLSIAVSAAGSYLAAGSIATGWTNAFGEMTLAQAQAAGLTGATGVGAAGTGGTLAASQAANAAYSASNFIGPLQAGVLPPAFGTTNTVINIGKSAEAYANAAKAIASGSGLSGINKTVLSGLLNNTAFVNSLKQPLTGATKLGLGYKTQVPVLQAAAGTGSPVVDSAIKVLDAAGKFTGTFNAEGLLTTTAGTTDAVMKVNQMKEATKEAEVKAEEFGESFETVYQDAYSKDVADSQDSIGALGSAMNPASRFTRRYGRNRFVDA